MPGIENTQGSTNNIKLCLVRLYLRSKCSGRYDRILSERLPAFLSFWGWLVGPRPTYRTAMLMLIKSCVTMTLREMSLSGQKLPPKDLSDFDKLRLSWTWDRDSIDLSEYILTVTFIVKYLVVKNQSQQYWITLKRKREKQKNNLTIQITLWLPGLLG